MTNGQTKALAPIEEIKGYVVARGQNLQNTLRGTGLDVQRFLTIAFNQTLQNPALLECTPASWFDALQKAGTHGLYPDGIHAALVPYAGNVKVRVQTKGGGSIIETKKAKLVQFQPMYQGLVQRAYATKQVTRMWAEVVYAGEQFEEVSGSEPRIIHEKSPARGKEKDALVACYACARVNGETHFIVLYAEEVERHKRASKTAMGDFASSSPWTTHTAEMWKKTALIALSKTLPHFNAAAQKFSALVDDSEKADLGIESIDVEAVAVEDDAARKPDLDDVARAAQAQAAQAQPQETPAAGECVHNVTVLTLEEPVECAKCGRYLTMPEQRAKYEVQHPKKGGAK